MAEPALSPKDAQSLARLVGSDHVSTGDVDRILYSHDRMSRSAIQSRKSLPTHRPQAIVWPANTSEVAAVVRWAGRRRLPVIAYGGGSGVSGGTVPVHGGLIVDLKRLDKIEQIQDSQLLAVVQAGILVSDLEERLHPLGYTQGHFPSSIAIATLGGSIAARGAGQLSTKYGVIEDQIEAIEVVLPSGAVLPFDAKQVPKLPGVHALPLFIGSEGTLGIITRARVRLHRLPETSLYRGLSFVHLSDALVAIRRLMQSGIRPAVLRLYDPLDSLLLRWGYERGLHGGLGRILESVTRPILDPVLRVLNPIKKQVAGQALDQFLAHPRMFDFLMQRLPSNCLLVLGFEGDEKFIAAQEAAALNICRASISRDEGRSLGEHWLQHRYSVSFKMPVLFSEGNFVDTIEVAATWDRIEELYHAMRKAIARHCLVMSHFSHAYPEGCSIYFTFVGSENKVRDELKTYDAVWHDAMDTCLRLGGTISHHHGIGLLKARYMPQELGNLMDLFRQFKNTLDPQGIMNPGKMGLNGSKSRKQVAS